MSNGRMSGARSFRRGALVAAIAVLALLGLDCSHPRQAATEQTDRNSSTGCVVLDLSLQIDESSAAFLELRPEGFFDEPGSEGSSYPLAATTIYNPRPPLCWRGLPAGTYDLALHFARFSDTRPDDPGATTILEPLVPAVIVKGVKVVAGSVSYQEIPYPLEPTVAVRRGISTEGLPYKLRLEWGGVIDTGECCPDPINPD